MDFPTTGGWGQTNSQWAEGKTAYEVIEARRNKMRNQTNRLRQQKEAVDAFLIEIETFARIMSDSLTETEVGALRRQYSYYSKKREFLTVALNNSSNELKRCETDLYNFKQRR